VRRVTASLTWPKRRWLPGQPLELATTELVERVVGSAGAPCQRLVLGDALDVAGAAAASGLEGKVDVIYIDPPYASQADYHLEARLDGRADGRVRRTKAYEDNWDELGDYLDMLAPRLEAGARLLAPTGTIWVHLDWRAAYLVRVLLDEIMGRERFLNEIVWRRAPNLGRQATSAQFGRTLDTLVVYGKPDAVLNPPTRLEPIEPGAIRWDDEGRPFTAAPRGDYTDASIAKLEQVGRVHHAASGKVYIKYFLTKNEDGEWCRERRVDALWTDVAPLRHAKPGERTGYPTQKPRALLERIVRCASPPGGLVVDLFAGSGTTAEAAHVTGRRSVCGDAKPAAIATARARLLRAGAAVDVERVAGVAWPEAAPPRVAVEDACMLERSAVTVTLLEPSEPLAWSIDPAWSGSGAFHTAWHAERAPGARAVKAAHEATVVRADGPLGVRVFADDGAMGTVVVR
jgi:DNA modification methylase